MSINQADLIGFIAEHPDATSADVAAHFGSTLGYASTRLKQMVDAKRIVVSKTGKTLTNRRRNHYQVVPVSPDAEKPERATVVEKMAKVKRTPTSENTLVNPQPAVLSIDLTDTIKTLAASLVDSLVSHVVAAVHTDLATKLAASLPNITLPQLPAPTTDAPDAQHHYDDAVVVGGTAAPIKPKARRPKIGVVGLLPQQRVVIDKEFSNDIDLLYWKDESNAALKSLGISCSITFVTKWASHSQMETLKSVGANARFLHGGMDQLRDALTDAYVEYTQ